MANNARDRPPAKSNRFVFIASGEFQSIVEVYVQLVGGCSFVPGSNATMNHGTTAKRLEFGNGNTHLDPSVAEGE